MKNKLFHKNVLPKNAVEQIETWASNDLNLLDEFGAACFSTNQLITLKQRLHAQAEQLQVQQKLLTWFALSSIGWAVIGVAAYVLGFDLAARIVLYFSPLTLLAWLGFLLFLNRKTERIPTLSHRIYLINQELENRRHIQFF